MNIWLLTGEYPPDYGGGIATYNYHTAEMLRQRGHQVTVFAGIENHPGSLEIEEPTDGLRVVRFGADQRPQSSALGEFARWSYDAAKVVEEFCQKEGTPDVLEVQEYLGMPYHTLQQKLSLNQALKDLPVLVTAHTPLYLCHLYDLLPTYRFPGYWIGEMERFSLLAADEVVFPSSYLRDEIEKELPQVHEHSRVIANPYQDLSGLSGEIHNQARSGFLFTAKIERRKGIEPLLSTFRQLWDEGLEESLYLVGDDWYDELKQQWMSKAVNQRYGKYIEAKLLRWEGKQPQEILKHRLGEVRAMVLPSLIENYPYAVLEAMAAGCPVIVSESGGHAEMVENGVSGYVFSHLEAGDLKVKIETALQLTAEEHDQMAAAAMTRIKQISSYEIVAPQKEEAYERVRQQIHPRKYFPFLRELPRDDQAGEGHSEAGEPGLLSVVITFYNLGNYLEDALKSFDDLRDVPFEVIVVDDGSNDQHSIEVLNQLHERYQFYLERTTNQGCGTARNIGAGLARGEFLAFLDADDCMDPRLYPKAIEILSQYENVSYVGCWAEYFGEVQGYWPTWNPEPPYALVHNPINTAALVYRKADFLRHGLNDPAMAFIMEDYDSLLCMLENGCRGVVIPEPFFKYRVRSDSMFHTTNDIFKIWTYQQITEKHQAFFKAYSEEIMSITNANGPGYLFDNPTIWYPPVGYSAAQGASADDKTQEVNLAAVPKRALFGYLLRSILQKILGKLRKTSPG